MIFAIYDDKHSKILSITKIKNEDDAKSILDALEKAEIVNSRNNYIRADVCNSIEKKWYQEIEDYEIEIS